MKKLIRIYLFILTISPFLFYGLGAYGFYIDKLIRLKKYGSESELMMCVPVIEIISILMIVISLIFIIWLSRLKSKLQTISTSQYIQIIIIGIIIILPLLTLNLMYLFNSIKKTLEYYSIN
jgi:hypothetical protein